MYDYGENDWITSHQEGWKITLAFFKEAMNVRN